VSLFPSNENNRPDYLKWQCDVVGKSGCYDMCAYDVSKNSLSVVTSAVEMFGAKCNECGYDKNFACLTFHHKNPKTKKFCLDLRVCSNKSWKSLLEEVAKCELLCNRCHGEHHNPQLNAKDCYDKMNKFIEFNDSLNKYKKIDCLYCRQSFHPNKYTQKYCSEKCCKLNSRKVARPSKEELEKDLSEMSYVKTGAKYGVSDNAVRKWIKQYSKLN
jgi:hypothetical protein